MPGPSRPTGPTSGHGYEKVVTELGRAMLRRARIAFGLGIVENGYDETAAVQAFLPADLEAGERDLLRQARSLDGPAALRPRSTS